ncbi:beta-xylosidase [Pseudomonas chengduensis]|nr:beta-xylosidase [Pseudomonas chengduensis]MDH1282224.1 beta-xylosidase [Pseudomonas chengduensis]MDH1681896.1 beta-xylosidase [Pseudomonas chengduensis]
MRKTAAVLMILLLGGLLLWGIRVDAQMHEMKAPREIVWKDFLGVNAQFLWFSPDRYTQQMQRLKDLGLEWVRLDLHWDQLELAEGQYNVAALDVLVRDLEKEKLKSVFYLVGSARFITTAPPESPYQDQYPPRDPEVFAQRMALLAMRYPSVDAWQVWNEPNLLGFWRPEADAAGYARLLEASSLALRAVAPEKPVVGAGLAFFSDLPGGKSMFEQLGQLGVQRLNTVVAYHPYTQLPEGNMRGSNDFALRTQELNGVLRRSGVPAIWATEWGWSSYAGPKEAQDIIGRNGQADYVLRRLALMSTQDFDRVFLFTLNDLDARASVRDRDYGLLDLEGKPKPVYLALQRFLAITGPRLAPAEPPQIQGTVDGLYSIAWKTEQGRHLWMFWAEKGGDIELPGVTRAVLHDPLTGRETSLGNGSWVMVKAKPSLQILTWD